MLKRTIKAARDFAEDQGDKLIVTVEVYGGQFHESGRSHWYFTGDFHQSKILEVELKSIQDVKKRRRR